MTRSTVPVTHLRLKRIYEPAAPEDGMRILVDRLWPRGISKADAALDEWMKELAPSTELRRWFAHDPLRWEEFRLRYRAELQGHADVLGRLAGLVAEGTVTLLYGARDEEHNDAVVLKDVLLQGLGKPRD